MRTRRSGAIFRLARPLCELGGRAPFSASHDLCLPFARPRFAISDSHDLGPSFARPRSASVIRTTSVRRSLDLGPPLPEVGELLHEVEKPYEVIGKLLPICSERSGRSASFGNELIPTRTTWTSPISRALHELGARADSDSHDMELRMTRSSRARELALPPRRAVDTSTICKYSWTFSSVNICPPGLKPT